MEQALAEKLEHIGPAATKRVASVPKKVSSVPKTQWPQCQRRRSLLCQKEKEQTHPS